MLIFDQHFVFDGQPFSPLYTPSVPQSRTQQSYAFPSYESVPLTDPHMDQ